MSIQTENVRSFRNHWIASAAGSWLAFAVACSPSKGNVEGAGASGGIPSGSSGGAAGAGSGGAPGAGSVGAGGVGSGAGGLITEIPEGKGGGSDTDAACAGLVLEPEVITVSKDVTVELDCTSEVPQPIALYLVLDNSQSMNQSNKWTDAVAAITAFVQSDPNLAAKPWTCVDKEGKSAPAPSTLPPVAAAGAVSVAIQYFHPQQVGGGVDECNGTGHGTPAVPMGPIPATAGAITASLGTTGPQGDTPTVGALGGGTQYCAGYQTRSACSYS
jgi:hypothetical protein